MKLFPNGVCAMEAVRAVFEAAAQRKLVLMIDLDGATIVRQPGVHDPVASEPEFQTSLMDLMTAQCPVSINTGRPQKFVENLFPDIVAQSEKLPFWLSTETGAFIQRPDRSVLFQKQVPEIQKLKDIFNQELKAHPGGFVEEHKMCAITISLAAAVEKKEAYSHMLTVCNDVAAGMEGINIIPVYKPTDAYIEIVPAGTHKGTATEMMMDEIGWSGMTIVCFGDSNADENMMVAVNNADTMGAKGFSFGVGPKSPDVAATKLLTHHDSQKVIGMLSDLALGKINVNEACQRYSNLNFAN